MEWKSETKLTIGKMLTLILHNNITKKLLNYWETNWNFFFYRIYDEWKNKFSQICEERDTSNTFSNESPLEFQISLNGLPISDSRVTQF